MNALMTKIASSMTYTPPPKKEADKKDHYSRVIAGMVGVAGAATAAGAGLKALRKRREAAAKEQEKSQRG
jgi:hypothetical protein